MVAFCSVGYMRHSYHLTVSMGLEDVGGCFCVASNVIKYVLFGELEPPNLTIMPFSFL